MLPWTQLTWWQGSVVWMPDYVATYRIPRPPESPRGHKGLALRALWKLFRGRFPGFITVDPDIAIEPDGVLAMERLATADPGTVWVAPYRLWEASAQGTIRAEIAPGELDGMRQAIAYNPDGRIEGNEVVTTPRPAGSWCHRVLSFDEAGAVVGARWGRPDDDDVHMWGFGCTYIPMAVCEAMEANDAWEQAHYPVGDLVVNQISRAAGIRARLAPGVRVLHMHWCRESVEALRGESP